MRHTDPPISKHVNAPSSRLSFVRPYGVGRVRYAPTHRPFIYLSRSSKPRRNYVYLFYTNDRPEFIMQLSPAEVSKQIKSLIKRVPDARADAARLDELRRLFARIEASGELEFGVSPPENPVAAKWRTFLLKYYKSMISQLCERIIDGRHSAIRCLFGVIAASPLTDKEGSYKYINTDLLQKWFQSMAMIEAEEIDKGMRHMVELEFIQPYQDVQYYSLGTITQLATAEYSRNSNSSSSKIAEKVLQFLMMIPMPASNKDLESGKYLFAPSKNELSDETDSDSNSSSDEDDGEGESDIDSDDENEKRRRPSYRRKRRSHKHAFQQLKAFRREYQKAWLAVLKLYLPIVSLKRSLQFLPDHVFKHVPNPLRFSDFFMQAYSDHGKGVVGVFALDGLFLLITEHGLEYPNFYSQLYRLISPRVMYAKYRERFFSLLSKCLTRNEMLPAHLVAAFMKKLCRSVLSAPPPAALFVLGLVSNLLRKHSECICLIHRNSDNSIEDLFLAAENDPTASKALRSSLWELAALERHYHHAVCTLAKSIGSVQESKSPLHNMNEFSSYTYKSLFDMERKKKTKTALTFTEPSCLLTEDDMFSNIVFCPRGENKSIED
jgi:U3 small nucleolar RNA-associated protein 19